MPPEMPSKKPAGRWVQTDKATHEAWADLSRRSPLASQIMHLLVARVGDHNAVVISQNALAGLTKSSRRGVQKALAILKDDLWIEPRQIGSSGSVNAYVINDRVAWAQGRDGLRYSLFSANVIVSEEEQPDRDSLGFQAAIRRLPDVYSGEAQLPSGEGLPPVSQPALPGMDHELPARQIPEFSNSEISKLGKRGSKEFPELQSDQFVNLTRDELLALARAHAQNLTSKEFSEREMLKSDNGEIEE